MDSTGTLIQEIAQSRYVFFGSADRKVYIRSYPDLQPVGELNIHLPPWNESTGTRIWPNIIPLPGRQLGIVAGPDQQWHFDGAERSDSLVERLRTWRGELNCRDHPVPLR